jgi:hypothetical protein
LLVNWLVAPADGSASRPSNLAFAYSEKFRRVVAVLIAPSRSGPCRMACTSGRSNADSVRVLNGSATRTVSPVRHWRRTSRYVPGVLVPVCSTPLIQYRNPSAHCGIRRRRSKVASPVKLSVLSWVRGKSVVWVTVTPFSVHCRTDPMYRLT